MDTCIKWHHGLEQTEGKDAVAKLREQIRITDDKKSFLVVHSWNDKASWVFEGYKVMGCTISNPNTPEEKFTFQLADSSGGQMKPIRERMVWPTEHANADEDIYPLLGVQII